MAALEFMLSRETESSSPEDVEAVYSRLLDELDGFFHLNERSHILLLLADFRKQRTFHSHRLVREHLAGLRGRSPMSYSCVADITYVDVNEVAIQTHMLVIAQNAKTEVDVEPPSLHLTFRANTQNFERSRCRIDDVFVEQAQLLGATSGRYFALREPWLRSPAVSPKDKVWCLADGMILRFSLVERIGPAGLQKLATRWVEYRVDDDRYVACVLDWLKKEGAIRDLLEPHLGLERTDLTPTEDKNVRRLQ